MPISNFHLLLGFSGILALIMSFALAVIARTYPASIKGLKIWSQAALIWATGFFLLIGRGSIPDFLSFVVANCLLVSGFTLFLIGLVRFLEIQIKRLNAFCLALNVVVFFIFVWFVLIQPSFVHRAWTLISSILILVIYTYWLLIKQYKKSFGWNYMLVIYAIILVTWILRAIALSKGKLTQNFNEIETIEHLLLIVTAPVSVAMGLLGCVILASEKLHDQLEKKSRFDALTNCLSRSTILEEIQKEILRSVRQKSTFALMMMDLDNFKTINDTLGHLHGDRILVDFSNKVTETIRQIDRLGRVGGDEFIVLLPDTTEETARNVAARIYEAGNRGDHLSWQVSVGIAVWGGPNDSLNSLMERADKSLYEEKARK